MKKVVFTILFLAMSSNAYAWALYCTNCSNFITQLMDRVTNIEELRYKVMEYAEVVQQTYQQIELVKNNILQYENMLKNTAELPEHLISMVSGDLKDLAGLTRSLKTVRSDVSAMGAIYDDLFPNQNYYKDIAGLGREELPNGNVIINTEFDEMSQRIDEATKATFQLSGQQLQDLEDSGELENYINDLLSTPTGQMQALSSANQLSSLQLQESRQLRELVATQMQADISAMARDEKENQLSEEVAREITDMADFDINPKVEELPLF